MQRFMIQVQDSFVNDFILFLNRYGSNVKILESKNSFSDQDNIKIQNNSQNDIIIAQNTSMAKIWDNDVDKAWDEL